MRDISWIRADRVDDMMRQKVQDDAEIEEMAAMEREMIERMTRLEERFKSHQETTEDRFEHTNKKIDVIAGKVDKLYDVFTQAKGARYVAAFGLAGVGGIVGAKATAILQYLGFRIP